MAPCLVRPAPLRLPMKGTAVKKARHNRSPASQDAPPGLPDVQVRLPNGEPLDVSMALTSGPASSGLLGTTSLTYQVGSWPSITLLLLLPVRSLTLTRMNHGTWHSAAVRSHACGWWHAVCATGWPAHCGSRLSKRPAAASAAMSSWCQLPACATAQPPVARCVP